jgi:hypothetical protein
MNNLATIATVTTATKEIPMATATPLATGPTLIDPSHQQNRGSSARTIIGSVQPAPTGNLSADNSFVSKWRSESNGIGIL